MVEKTPNGLMTFISVRRGGRISQIGIIEKNGYLDDLPKRFNNQINAEGSKELIRFREKKAILLYDCPAFSSFYTRPFEWKIHSSNIEN